MYDYDTFREYLDKIDKKNILNKYLKKNIKKIDLIIK